MNVEDPPWRVRMLRQADGSYLISLVAGDISLELDALDAHRLGSALHAAAGPHLNRDPLPPL